MDKKKTPAPAVSPLRDAAQHVDTEKDHAAARTTDAASSAPVRDLSDTVPGSSIGPAAATQNDAAAQDDSGQQDPAQDGTASHPHRTRGRRSHAGHVRSRSRVLRTVVSPILLVAALVCAVFAVLQMTVWRPSPTVEASTTVSTRYAVTDPGVLSLVDRSADASLSADRPVCLALATSQDASGWVSGRRYTRVTGLSSWTALSSRTMTATSVTDAGGSVRFRDSDLWRTVSCGRSVDLRTTASASSPLVLILDTNPSVRASSNAGRPARLTLTWTRTHTTDAALPLWLCAALLALASVLCFFIFSLSARRRRKAHGRQTAVPRGDPELRGEQSRSGLAGADAPRWADDHLRSRRRRESRHRHAGAHRGFFSSVRRLAATSGPAAEDGHKGGKDSGTADGRDDRRAPAIQEPGRANMVARLQETQTMAPISAPIRTDGVGTQIDNGEGRPPSYTPPSSEEIQDYLRRLAQERLGTDALDSPDAQDSPDEDHPDNPRGASGTDASQKDTSDQNTTDTDMTDKEE